MQQFNKLYGRKMGVVGITQEMFNNKPKYVIAPMGPGIQWVLNLETLKEYEVDHEIIECFLKQLEKIGTIGEIRQKLNLQPMGGGIYCGLVLKHKDRPEILANVYVYSGPNVGYNTNTYALPYDIMLELFIDVDRVGPTTERETEQEFKEVNALTHSGMGRYGWQDQIEVEYEDETKGVGPAENKMEAKTPIVSGDYEGFYQLLAEEEKFDANEWTVIDMIRKNGSFIDHGDHYRQTLKNLYFNHIIGPKNNEKINSAFSNARGVEWIASSKFPKK
jgi:hypothetical protein